jgi:hypothetical protein
MARYYATLGPGLLHLWGTMRRILSQCLPEPVNLYVLILIQPADQQDENDILSSV